MPPPHVNLLNQKEDAWLFSTVPALSQHCLSEMCGAETEKGTFCFIFSFDSFQTTKLMTSLTEGEGGISVDVFGVLIKGGVVLKETSVTGSWMGVRVCMCVSVYINDLVGWDIL